MIEFCKKAKILAPAHLLFLVSALQGVYLLPASAAAENDQPPIVSTTERRESSQTAADVQLAEELNKLADQYAGQGSYTQAEPLYLRALAIMEKTLGPAHPDLADSLNILALLYHTQGRDAQAEALYKRVIAITEKEPGPNHPDLATSLTNLAGLYVTQGRYAQAEPLYQRALLIREKALGPEHLDVAGSLAGLAGLYHMQGRFVQAEPLYQRALAIREKALGPEHLDVATSLNDLAWLYSILGSYAQAEPLFKRVIAIREKEPGPNHPDLATSLTNLAGLYVTQGRYAQAEPLYQRALLIREKALGPEHLDVAGSLAGLAGLYHMQGRFVQAEPLYQRALAITEKALGPEHIEVAGILNNLAVLYLRQGRYAQVEPLYQRALLIQEKALAPENSNVAASLINLANLYVEQGRYAHAEPLYQRALPLMEKALGPDHPNVANSLNNLAELYATQGRYAQAEPLYRRALPIMEKVLGPEHPNVADSLLRLAALCVEQGRYAQAEQLYQRALHIREMALAADHPDLANAQQSIAKFYRRRGKAPEGLSHARASTAIYRKRILAGGSDESALREARQNQTGFFTHLALLDATRDPAQPQLIADEAFQVAQLAQASNTAAALAKMAARFASGKDALGELARRRQDAAEQSIGLEKQWVSQISQPAAQRQADRERELREALTKSRQTLAQIDSELNQRFPEYQVLTRPEPISVAQVQALLKPQEAMVMFSVGADVSYGWMIKADRVAFYRLAITRKELADKVMHVRNNMRFDSLQRGPRFDLTLLHDLYQRLFGPMAADLAGVDELVLVPSGPLQSLAFASLITSPPPAIKTDADYRQVDWLVKHVALSVLPSANAIRALREFTKASHAKLPLIGFGDPVLQGKSVDGSTTRGKVDIAGVFRGAPASLQGRHADIANVDAIRQYDPLPETDVELEKLAITLKADKRRALKLRNEATESQVKQTDLSRYRHLAFATHGAMAGEIPGADEPGLILTPPKVGSELDDGYLSAGEIAKLKLNADWVILSACNTAAADGTPGAEGLSGLARAFFYAGARSLLVSQWSVDSESSMKLTTGLFETLQMEPTLSRAKAQQKSMLNLMNDTANAKFAHPAHWAPFMVVGEGGNVQVSNKALSPTRPLESRIRD